MNKRDETAKELDKRVEYTLLYDFYGSLLKDGHRGMYEDYMLNDLSLGEIAQENGISRQGVFDVIKRNIKKLQGYEEKLQLIKQYNQATEKIQEIQAAIQTIRQTGDTNPLDRIERSTLELLELIEGSQNETT